MDNRVAVAVIGVGYMGRLHIQKYATMKDVEIVAICDLNIEKGQELACELACLFFQSYKELPLSELHAVSIASDTPTHADIGKFFLENGIDVLIEKPIASSIEEAMDLVNSAKANSCILQVGHLERFNPVFIKLKSCLNSPRYFEIKRITPYRGRGADVDVVLDLMIHDIDLLLDLVGEEVVKVDAIGIPVLTSSIDVAQVRIEFDSGVVANVSASRVATGSERTMRIFQPDEYISVDLLKKHFKRFKKIEKPGVHLPIEIEEQSFDQSDPLYDQLLSFIGAVRTRTGVVVSGLEAVHAIRVVQKIKDSIQTSLDKFSANKLESKRAVG